MRLVTLSTFPTFAAFLTRKLCFLAPAAGLEIPPSSSPRGQARLDFETGTNLPQPDGLGRWAIAAPEDHPGERYRRPRLQDVS